MIQNLKRQYLSTESIETVELAKKESTGAENGEVFMGSLG